RDHVNLLNNQHAKSENSRYDLQHKLRNIEKWTDKDGKERYKFTEFKKPYNNFTVDAKNALEKIIVSFKQNLRVIKKATNNYEKYQDGKKTEIKQEGVNWAIRKPLHKDTVFAKVYLLDETKEMTLKKALEKVKQTRDINIIVDKKLREIVKTLFKIYNDEEIQSSLKNERLKNISKVKVFEQKAATRFLNDLVSVFNGVSAADKAKETIKKITDTGIQKILFAHLSAKENNPTLAFSPEGIEEMNKNIVQLNDNKPHQPVYKVRIYEPIGNKFQVGYVGNKKDKYVEAAKSTNLFFAVYVDENGNRTFETIPLNVVIERLKQGLPEVPEHNDKGHLLLFHLSPNDLVYVPKKEEVESTHIKMIANLNRIYKIVSFTGNRLYAVPYYVAKSLVDKVEYTQLNKVESDIEDNLSIKHVCIKLKIDRLGGIL
ncbi:MAG: type II CRISPR RNA-guided endonuclease Cas9, partial [Prevotellaceae bacterium]|nr:type II CRISPR RNA-guided endonuclease Cas9 [Prevotellaceae bacterium]